MKKPSPKILMRRAQKLGVTLSPEQALALLGEALPKPSRVPRAVVKRIAQTVSETGSAVVTHKSKTWKVFKVAEYQNVSRPGVDRAKKARAVLAAKRAAMKGTHTPPAVVPAFQPQP